MTKSGDARESLAGRFGPHERRVGSMAIAPCPCSPLDDRMLSGGLLATRVAEVATGRLCNQGYLSTYPQKSPENRTV